MEHHGQPGFTKTMLPHALEARDHFKITSSAVSRYMTVFQHEVQLCTKVM
jgi:hypothetical protein